MSIDNGIDQATAELIRQLQREDSARALPRRQSKLFPNYREEHITFEEDRRTRWQRFPRCSNDKPVRKTKKKGVNKKSNSPRHREKQTVTDNITNIFDSVKEHTYPIGKTKCSPVKKTDHKTDFLNIKQEPMCNDRQSLFEKFTLHDDSKATCTKQYVDLYSADRLQVGSKFPSENNPSLKNESRPTPKAEESSHLSLFDIVKVKEEVLSDSDDVADLPTENVTGRIIPSLDLEKCRAALKKFDTHGPPLLKVKEEQISDSEYGGFTSDRHGKVCCPSSPSSLKPPIRTRDLPRLEIVPDSEMFSDVSDELECPPHLSPYKMFESKQKRRSECINFATPKSAPLADDDFHHRTVIRNWESLDSSCSTGTGESFVTLKSEPFSDDNEADDEEEVDMWYSTERNTTPQVNTDTAIDCSGNRSAQLLPVLSHKCDNEDDISSLYFKNDCGSELPIHATTMSDLNNNHGQGTKSLLKKLFVDSVSPISKETPFDKLEHVDKIDNETSVGEPAATNYDKVIGCVAHEPDMDDVENPYDAIFVCTLDGSGDEDTHEGSESCSVKIESVETMDEHFKDDMKRTCPVCLCLCDNMKQLETHFLFCSDESHTSVKSISQLLGISNKSEPPKEETKLTHEEICDKLAEVISSKETSYLDGIKLSKKFIQPFNDMYGVSCRICGRWCSNVPKLATHEQSHARRGIHAYACKICDRGFYSQKEYDDHTIHAHLKTNKPYIESNGVTSPKLNKARDKPIDQRLPIILKRRVRGRPRIRNKSKISVSVSDTFCGTNHVQENTTYNSHKHNSRTSLSKCKMSKLPSSVPVDQARRLIRDWEEFPWEGTTKGVPFCDITEARKHHMSRLWFGVQCDHPYCRFWGFHNEAGSSMCNIRESDSDIFCYQESRKNGAEYIDIATATDKDNTHNSVDEYGAHLETCNRDRIDLETTTCGNLGAGACDTTVTTSDGDISCASDNDDIVIMKQMDDGQFEVVDKLRLCSNGSNRKWVKECTPDSQQNFLRIDDCPQTLITDLVQDKLTNEPPLHKKTVDDAVVIENVDDSPALWEESGELSNIIFEYEPLQVSDDDIDASEVESSCAETQTDVEVIEFKSINV